MPTVVPTKSDSDVIFCIQLFSKTLTYVSDLSIISPWLLCKQNMTPL